MNIVGHDSEVYSGVNRTGLDEASYFTAPLFDKKSKDKRAHTRK